MTSRPFDFVIFDCDGVLVDSERLSNAIVSQHLSRLGLDVSPDEAMATFKGRTVAEVAAIAESQLHTKLPADWVYDWGMHIALGFVRNLQTVPGVQQVLDGLISRGVATCVASQSPRARVDLALSVTNLAHYFDDRVYTASMVPRGKPLPDLFLYAAARMGAEPGRCAVIEDSESGVRAAIAAGMSVFGYAADEDPAALRRAGATAFSSIEELPALLECDPGHRKGARAERAGESEAVARLREAYGAFAAGEGHLLAALLAEDVTYHLPGRHLGGGTLRSRAEVLERTAQAALSCDAPPTIRLNSVVGSGEYMLSIERFVARRGGRTVDQDVCVVWRMAGARCSEIWSTFSDQVSCDRFWEGGWGEQARADSHGEARAESAPLRSEILQFFESYRDAFNRLAAEDVARHFWVPSTMSTNDGYTVWTDASQVLNNMVALCDSYRAHGFSAAHCELLDIIDQPPAHAVANVRWLIDRHGDLLPWRFRTSYNLRCEAGRWRILLCTAYEEQSSNACRRA